ncbi:hypothetical protein ACQ4PT_010017 [Festuca glaucescens]
MGDPGCTGGDRLSELPDCLLHRILSHLKARQVVQTCVLSRSRGSENQFASASGFPVLEVLDLRGCSYDLGRIESATLKSLTICECHNRIEEDVVIATPSLTSLLLRLPFHREYNSRRFYAAGFTVDEAPSLVEASITVVDIDQYNAFSVDEVTIQSLQLFKTLRKLLGSISHVNNLDLSGFKATSGECPFIMLQKMERSRPFLTYWVSQCIPPDMYEDIALEFDRLTSPVPLLDAVLDEAQGDLPVFRNLTTLVVDEYYMSTSLHTLWHLLLHTPFLEKLTLQCCKFPDFTRREETRSISNRVPDQTKHADTKCNDTDEDGHDAVPNLKLVEIKYKE